MRKINRKIEIRDLTFVLNLKVNSAKNYLQFNKELKIIKTEDKTDCLSTSRLEDDFLMIYIKCSSINNIIINKILQSIKLCRIKAIAIDELFPENNEFILKTSKLPCDAKWIFSKVFNAKNSYLEVN